MNTSTLIFIRNYMRTHKYGENGDYTFVSLFKKYFEREIESIQDIEKVGYQYLNLICSLHGFFNDTLPEELGDEMNEEFNCINTSLRTISDNRERFIQQCYANLIESVVGDKNSKILDVGAGAVPLSSIYMGMDGSNVTAMDKLMLSNEFLSKYNVHGKSQYFKQATIIRDYDVVVGFRPCSAIKDIVERCALENKGYLIALCDCEVNNHRNKKGNIARSWKEILPQYDRKVKFYDRFAYNLDISPKQIKIQIDKFNNEFGGCNCADLLLSAFFAGVMSDVIKDIVKERNGSEPNDD